MISFFTPPEIHWSYELTELSSLWAGRKAELELAGQKQSLDSQNSGVDSLYFTSSNSCVN